ncbi:RWP-RK domain-containing transcription factor [Volvox carteri f. nagariensis]|uniref:RWP-RK domain-containing transcription factor n=1 Tax=Volvox carteri f. nagariensis TaxID=3068 RepID=D8TUK1_VOLCA|nr:RWP-RK domain-containing transcription factor [Volvox carteri f. nagariensis]EFJ48722.1 RWP-RK domain-containing transcription factor [Volvox carteri f. nagariensis]|eukprot:XP_002950054.1 RWP-RK domain-containing transcription factor [Volvox carteri f. nagariensis]
MAAAIAATVGGADVAAPGQLGRSASISALGRLHSSTSAIGCVRACASTSALSRLHACASTSALSRLHACTSASALGRLHACAWAWASSGAQSFTARVYACVYIHRLCTARTAAHGASKGGKAKPQLLQPLVCAHPRGDLPSRYPRLQPLEAQPAQVGQLPSQPKLQLQPDPLPLLPLPPPPPPPLPPQLLSSSHYDDVQEEDYLMAEILAAPWPSSKTVQDATAAAHAAAAALARTKLVTHNERANPQPKPSGAPQQVSMEAAAASAFAAPECGPNTPSQSPPPLPESWQGSRRVQAAPDDAPLKKLNEAVVEAAPAPARPRWISVHDQGAVPWKIKAELGGAEVKAEMRPLGQSAMALGSDHPRANLTLKQQTTLLYEHQLQLVVPQGDLRLGQLDMAASRKLAAGAAAAAAAAAASAGPVATDGADRGGTLLLHVPLAGGRTSSTVVVDDMHDDSMQDDLPPPPSLPLDVFMADDLAECDGEDSDCDSDVQVTMELLRSMFHLPVADVSRTLGVSSTDLKRRCRALGIGRWPQRKLTSLDKLGGAVASDPHISEDERQKTLALVARNRDDIIRDPDTALDPWVAPKRQMHYKRKFVDRRGGGRRSYGKKKGG